MPIITANTNIVTQINECGGLRRSAMLSEYRWSGDGFAYLRECMAAADSTGTSRPDAVGRYAVSKIRNGYL
jgi:hypothetical protein